MITWQIVVIMQIHVSCFRIQFHQIMLDFRKSGTEVGCSVVAVDTCIMALFGTLLEKSLLACKAVLGDVSVNSLAHGSKRPLR